MPAVTTTPDHDITIIGAGQTGFPPPFYEGVRQLERQTDRAEFGESRRAIGRGRSPGRLGIDQGHRRLQPAFAQPQALALVFGAALVPLPVHAQRLLVEDL